MIGAMTGAVTVSPRTLPTRLRFERERQFAMIGAMTGAVTVSPRTLPARLRLERDGRSAMTAAVAAPPAHAPPESGPGGGCP